MKTTEAVELAQGGGVVLHVSDSQTLARTAFNRAVEAAGDTANTIRRANGRESITFPSGGRVLFISAGGTGGRGISADVVIIPSSRDAYNYLPNVVASAKPSILVYGTN